MTFKLYDLKEERIGWNWTCTVLWECLDEDSEELSKQPQGPECCQGGEERELRRGQRVTDSPAAPLNTQKKGGLALRAAQSDREMEMGNK